MVVHFRRIIVHFRRPKSKRQEIKNSFKDIVNEEIEYLWFDYISIYVPQDGAVCLKSLLLEIGDQEQTDLLNPNRITFKEAVLESLPKERDLVSCVVSGVVSGVVSAIVTLTNLEKSIILDLAQNVNKMVSF